MKVSAFFRGVLYKNQVVLLPADEKDLPAVRKLFAGKKSREKRSGREILLKCEIDAAFQRRTFRQLSAAWKLVTVIFESMENRRPTEEEKYGLYLDLMEIYADKVPSKIRSNVLRPVHISESNTMAAARFIDGLLFHLASECELGTDLQADVRTVLYEWEIWRGKQEEDFKDTYSGKVWTKTAVYSEASGRSGNVECHHIISRGSAPQFAGCGWNMLALTHDEHMFWHKAGKNAFLEKYPHLRGKIERAERKSARIEQP